MSNNFFKIHDKNAFKQARQNYLVETTKNKRKFKDLTRVNKLFCLFFLVGFPLFIARLYINSGNLLYGIFMSLVYGGIMFFLVKNHSINQIDLEYKAIYQNLLIEEFKRNGFSNINFSDRAISLCSNFETYKKFYSQQTEFDYSGEYMGKKISLCSRSGKMTGSVKSKDVRDFVVIIEDIKTEKIIINRKIFGFEFFLLKYKKIFNKKMFSLYSENENYCNKELFDFISSLGSLVNRLEISNNFMLINFNFNSEIKPFYKKLNGKELVDNHVLFFDNIFKVIDFIVKKDI